MANVICFFLFHNLLCIAFPVLPKVTFYFQEIQEGFSNYCTGLESGLGSSGQSGSGSQ